MKQLRFIIIAFIAVAAGVFFWLTRGTGAETFVIEHLRVNSQHLVLVILLLSAFILLSTLSGLPVLYLTVAIGFLLRYLPALLISIVVNTIAVMATFYMVRYAFTGYITRKYGKKKLIKKINKRIRRYGLWSVVFSRAIYIFPTSIINFSFPLSHISTRSYFLGTLIGLLPECAINVSAGYMIKHGMILLSSPDARLWQILAIAGFILLLSLVFILLRIRQNRVKKFKRLKAIPYSSPGGHHKAEDKHSK